jgi:hypothetical protein
MNEIILFASVSRILKLPWETVLKNELDRQSAGAAGIRITTLDIRLIIMYKYIVQNTVTHMPQEGKLQRKMLTF